jgi:hypothetical protein
LTEDGVPDILSPILMKHIIDPRPLLEGAPPSSAIWALADAFDAATNGMENPEADARLLSATEPAFRPWKTMIAALKALYKDDREACLAAASSIEADSPHAVFVPLFRAWSLSSGSGRDAIVQRELAEAAEAVSELYGRLVTDAHPLGVLSEQAEEALRQGMIEHFEHSAARILRELHGNHRADGPFLALRYASYCLALLDEEGREESDFFSVIVRSLGRADGFLSLGLALIGRDACAAAAALRGALEASDGAFLVGSMRTIVAEAADALEDSETVSEDRIELGRRHGCEDKETRQLELFV